MKVEEMLYGYTNDVLKKFMDLTSATTPYGRKAEMVNYLADLLLNQTAVCWQNLAPLSQKAVAAAYHNGGDFDTIAFKAQYGSLPQRAPSRYGRYYSNPIWFELFIYYDQIPTDLVPRLADLVPPPDRYRLIGDETLPPKQPGEPDLIVAETEQIGFNDLLTYLRLVDQGIIKFSTGSGQATSASIRKIAENLIAGDFYPLPEKLRAKETIRPFGLDIFARESGLITRTGKLTKAGRTLLQTQDLEIFLEAVEKWAENGRFDELSRITAVKGQRSKKVRLTSAKERRSRVFEALSWCPTDVWIDINDFYRAVKVWQFDFEVEKTDYTYLSLGGSAHYDSWYSEDDYWLVVKGLFINAIIWEYLASIGAIDLAYVIADEANLPVASDWYWDDTAYSPFDGLCYFRINKLGAFLLGQASDYVPTQPKVDNLFTISADLELTLLQPAELQPNLRIMLEAISKPKDEHHYQLDTQRFLTALEEGQQWQALADFLQEYHDGVLETAVSDWLARLHHNSTAIKRGKNALFITISQPELTDMIINDKVLGTYAHAINKKTIVIPASRERAFRQRLKELEYLLVG